MRFRRRLEQQTTVSLVPMIDVVFQLVIFFMVSTTFRILPAIDLVLPSAATAVPVEATSVTITVVSADELYLDDERVDLAALEEQLASMRPPPGSVVLEGDRTISYELMIEVLDVLRRNGLTGVNLQTRVEAP